MSGGELWRVGHRGDPLAFTPFELCAWNHRFDDSRRRFRTVYCAERPDTSLREVLADFRPNLNARRAFAEAFGADALGDLPPAPVTARWREEHLLAPAEMVLDGELIDLTDPAVRADLERRHASLLVEHGPRASRPARDHLAAARRHPDDRRGSLRPLRRRRPAIPLSPGWSACARRLRGPWRAGRGRRADRAHRSRSRGAPLCLSGVGVGVGADRAPVVLGPTTRHRSY